MGLIPKTLIGAALVLLIQLLAKSKSFYIDRLVPLFPTFTLLSHFIVGTERTAPELQKTILFGMVSILPYLLYMLTLYALVPRFKLAPSLLSATATWTLGALLIIFLWQRVA
ncbi:MAG: hypothetical protein GTO14_00940 [Anaerolineales bacterium]|nr:hypothetical protein [Anaerolineales bacterium]